MKKVTFGGRKSLAALLTISAGILSGCGSQTTKSVTPPAPSTASSQGPQTYLSAMVAANGAQTSS
jgi:hypothetical protein